ADRNRSHWSTSKTPSYTKSVSWQHHLKIHRNYFFGDNGVGSGGGLYGDLNYTADTCRQCKEPQCMNVCPIGAITWQQKEGCITVDHKRCIGCSACTTACPWMMATVNTESKKSSKCVLCGECANACPTGALKIIEWKDITV
ncbi:ferredoxin-like protein, partial [Escherichia coli]|nr:ferredoxin-like protein [Escherichia coli]